MKHHMALGMLLVNFKQILQPTDVRHSISALERQGMAHNLVVLAVHI